MDTMQQPQQPIPQMPMQSTPNPMPQPPMQPSSSQPIEQQKSHFLRDLSLFILFLLVVGGAAYGGYYYGQKTAAPVTETTRIPIVPTQPVATSSPTLSTANWQTLTNTFANFSLQYPPTFQAIGIGMEPDPTKTGEININDGKSPSGIEISIVSSSNPLAQGKTLQQITMADYSKNLANVNLQPQSVHAPQAITFAGVPAYTFEIKSMGWDGILSGTAGTTQSDIIAVEFDRSGNHFLIYYAKNDTLTQIVNTFTFK